MKIQLSDHFTYKKLFQFVIPPILMVVFISIFNIIDDGIFVSNFVGKDAFVAVNILAPLSIIVGAIGFMIGAGGSAIVSNVLGQGDQDKANRYFSLIIWFAVGLGMVISLTGYIVLKPICLMFGIEGEVLKNCLMYGYIMLPFVPMITMETVFQNFLILAQKPNLAIGVTVISGICNIIFDVLLMVVFKFGIIGAALASCSGTIIGCVIPFIYFMTSKNSLIKLTTTSVEWKVIGKTCSNGVSELITNAAIGIVGMVYNYQLMNIVGEDGVAAYGVIMYMSFVFASIFIGYGVGVTPLIGYNNGAKKYYELKNIFNKSITFTIFIGVILAVVAHISAMPLAQIFVGYDGELLQLTFEAVNIYTLSFAFMGIGIFGSAFFTALNNGVVSGIISFMRKLVFEIGAVIILSALFGLIGIWSAVVIAEIFGSILTIVCLIKYRKKYNYA